MNAIDIFEKITARIPDGYDSTKSAIEGKRTRLLEAVANYCCTDYLPMIPAGTELKLDFAGDFGCYALANVQGTLHKVKIGLNDLMKIDWSFLNETAE